MINLEELQKKISNILNGLDTETSGNDNPCDDFYFLVKTYGTRLENVSNYTLKRNVIPVYINLVDSSVEPIEDLGEIDTTYELYIYFPLQYKEQFFDLGKFLVNCFNAKTLSYGTNSGNALTTLSIPELNDIEDVQLGELNSFLQQDFNLPIKKTEKWGVLTFQLFFYQVANLGEEDGFMYGNEIKYNLTYKSLSEDIVATQRVINYQGDTYAEQNFAESETGSIIKNGTTTWTINPYVRNNAFWKQFLLDFENGDLYNQTCVLKTTTPFGIYQRELLITSCISADTIGELKTCTITLTKKIGVNSTIITYYTLTANYYINGEEQTSEQQVLQLESGTRIYPSVYAKSFSGYKLSETIPGASFTLNSNNTINYYYEDAVLSDVSVSGGVMYYQGTIVKTLRIPTIEGGVMHYQGTIVKTLKIPTIEGGVIHYQGTIKSKLTKPSLSTSYSATSYDGNDYTLTLSNISNSNDVSVTAYITINGTTTTATISANTTTSVSITISGVYSGTGTIYFANSSYHDSETVSFAYSATLKATVPTYSVTTYADNDKLITISAGTRNNVDSYAIYYKTWLTTESEPSVYTKTSDNATASRELYNSSTSSSVTYNVKYYISETIDGTTITSDVSTDTVYLEAEEIRTLDAPELTGTIEGAGTSASDSDYNLQSSSLSSSGKTATATYRYAGSYYSVSYTITNPNSVAVDYSTSGAISTSGTLSAGESVTVSNSNATQEALEVTFSSQGYVDSSSSVWASGTIDVTKTATMNSTCIASTSTCNYSVSGDTAYVSDYSVDISTTNATVCTKCSITIGGDYIFGSITWAETL